MLPRHMQTRPEMLLQALAPSRAELVSAVAWLFPWYWRAELCAQAPLPFGLGHALYLKARPGGTAQNDQIDAQHIAGLRRGGRLPQASVSPAAMRATRALLRRRFPLTRKRAELLAHVQQPNRQDNWPERGTQRADQANRDGVADRCPAPAVQQSVALALALLASYARRLRAVELPLVQTAKEPKAQARDRRPAVPDIGTMLRVVLRYAIQAIPRVPRVQDFVSSCRLVKGAKEAAGNRDGTSTARRAALRSARGPFRQPRAWCCGTLRPPSTISPAWSINRARRKRERASRRHEPGQSIPGSHAIRGSIGRRASTGQGAERRRRTPPWTSPGAAWQGVR
jgi:hypothetical protein